VSDRGIHATVYDELGERVGHCLMIGPRIPRLHHSDGLPVMFVTEHLDGSLITDRQGQSARMLAYPSTLPGPGQWRGRYIWANYERLPFVAPIPLHDHEQEDDHG